MAKTHWWAIALIILTTALTSTAQVLLKIGMQRWPELLTNWPLFAGLACYALGALFMIISFSGGEVSILYPLFATSYIWVTIAASIMFGEKPGMLIPLGPLVIPLHYIGLALVFIGVSAVGFASRQSHDNDRDTQEASA
jgi:drug/metabolite transporter (DMT)-like permease